MANKRLLYVDTTAQIYPTTSITPYSLQHQRRWKSYELSNHLGSVMSTISDAVTGVSIHNNGHNDYFNAEVVSAVDYYPGGMGMVGRKFNSTAYRFGFNKGSEKDDEISGDGNMITTFYREADLLKQQWNTPDPIYH